MEQKDQLASLKRHKVRRRLLLFFRSLLFFYLENGFRFFFFFSTAAFRRASANSFIWRMLLLYRFIQNKEFLFLVGIQLNYKPMKYFFPSFHLYLRMIFIRIEAPAFIQLTLCSVYLFAVDKYRLSCG